MTGPDLEYIRRLLARKVITGPVLELGTGYGGFTAKQEIVASGLDHFGTDMAPGPGVDFAADFENVKDMEVFRPRMPFGSILILNVLEHTFDPIRILDNALSLLQPQGVIVAITPAVWPLHNFPMDAWRILPNFYEEYAKRRGLKLIDEYFEYLDVGRVTSFRSPDNSYKFPPPCNPGFRYQFSRVIHKLFNTFGRESLQRSCIAIGAVFQVK